MRVGTRLLLAVVPAVVGLGAVAALAYWGQYARQAPGIVIVAAVIAATGSLVLAWRNTRYVARRVERIASRAETQRADRDELDAIEHSVTGLADAVREAHEGRVAREAAAARRVADMTARLDETIAALADGLQAVQLPLHILLDSHFGTLNENQEEMLEAARAASELLEVRVRQARKLADVERGSVPVHVRPVGLAELLRPALAIAEARAAKRGVTLKAEISSTAARAVVDPVHAQEAVTILLGEMVERAEAGAELHASAKDGEDGTVHIRAGGGVAAGAPTLPTRLADALIRAQGGSLAAEGDGVVIKLPAEQVRRARG